MSHRIQAKIYESDTLSTLLARLRKIMPNISKENQIGLFHLYFIKQEEDETLGTLRTTKEETSKLKYRRHVKQMNLCFNGNVDLANDNATHKSGSCKSKTSSSVKELIQAPLNQHQIISDLNSLQESQNYLIVYIDTVNFSRPHDSGNPPQI